MHQSKKMMIFFSCQLHYFIPVLLCVGCLNLSYLLQQQINFKYMQSMRSISINGYLLVQQAIMYLLCFRMRSMMDDPQLKPWLVRLPLESILNNKLSPLKVRTVSGYNHIIVEGFFTCTLTLDNKQASLLYFPHLSSRWPLTLFHAI